MREVRQASFFPTEDPTGKPNCKVFYRIERDGSITKRAFLDVPDVSDRERLISIHYLRHMAMHFWKADIGVREVARDAPWDFSLELSSGLYLSIEVTSVADSPAHFQINKREERLSACVGRDSVPLHELRWLTRVFTEPHLSALVKEHEARGIQETEMVDNPLTREAVRIFLSTLLDPRERLEDQLRAVIDKKVKKRHEGKDRTVLIVDNRTSAYDVHDYVEAAEALQPYLEGIPFPEVWFYTGYCSDDSGNQAEFSFSPLKVTDEQAHILEAMAKQAGISNGRRIVW